MDTHTYQQIPMNSHPRQPMLDRVRSLVESRLSNAVRVEDMAAAAGLSTFHFARLFKELTGQTPHRYLVRARLDEAKQLLGSRDVSIRDVSRRAGFSSQAHFSHVFRRYEGVTPGRFRQQLLEPAAPVPSGARRNVGLPPDGAAP